MTARGLHLAVSPYHLAARDPAAMAALLLADAVVTLMPSPSGLVRGPAGGAGEAGRAVVSDAVERAPAFLRLMESWRWTMPLWRSGIITSGRGHDDAGGEFLTMHDQIVGGAGDIPGDAAFLPLRSLIRPGLLDDADERLDRICADVLKGGVDPGIGMLVGAGLDRFAARHGLTGVRAGPPPGGGSVSQRAEMLLGRRVFAVAVPILLHAGGERVLEAREALAPSLARLREAILAAAAGGVTAIDGLMHAVEAYTTAFSRIRTRLIEGDDEEGLRVQDGLVSITGVLLPSDSTMRASLTAARVLARQHGSSADPAASIPACNEHTLALVIRRMNLKRDADESGDQSSATHRAARSTR